jgi:type IV pilus biogenesis protein CpaD/CtpE
MNQLPSRVLACAALIAAALAGGCGSKDRVATGATEGGAMTEEREPDYRAQFDNSARSFRFL